MSDKLTPENSAAFDEVISIIDNAREKAFRAVNHELINMYWEIGKYVYITAEVTHEPGLNRSNSSGNYDPPVRIMIH